MKKALKYKLDLINDVSGLSYDNETIDFLKTTKLPFVLHHMKGNTETMQKKPSYKNVLLDIYDYFEDKLRLIRKTGIKIAARLKYKNISVFFFHKELI